MTKLNGYDTIQIYLEYVTGFYIHLSKCILNFQLRWYPLPFVVVVYMSKYA